MTGEWLAVANQMDLIPVSIFILQKTEIPIRSGVVLIDQMALEPIAIKINAFVPAQIQREHVSKWSSPVNEKSHSAVEFSIFNVDHTNRAPSSIQNLATTQITNFFIKRAIPIMKMREPQKPIPTSHPNLNSFMRFPLS
jgi:hypothetical protein